MTFFSLVNINVHFSSFLKALLSAFMPKNPHNTREKGGFFFVSVRQYKCKELFLLKEGIYYEKM